MLKWARLAFLIFKGLLYGPESYPTLGVFKTALERTQIGPYEIPNPRHLTWVFLRGTSRTTLVFAVETIPQPKEWPRTESLFPEFPFPPPRRVHLPVPRHDAPRRHNLILHGTQTVFIHLFTNRSRVFVRTGQPASHKLKQAFRIGLLVCYKSKKLTLSALIQRETG